MVLGFWLTPRFTELHVGQKTSSGHKEYCGKFGTFCDW